MTLEVSLAPLYNTIVRATRPDLTQKVFFAEQKAAAYPSLSAAAKTQIETLAGNGKVFDKVAAAKLALELYDKYDKSLTKSRTVKESKSKLCSIAKPAKETVKVVPGRHLCWRSHALGAQLECHLDLNFRHLEHIPLLQQIKTRMSCSVAISFQARAKLKSDAFNEEHIRTLPVCRLMAFIACEMQKAAGNAKEVKQPQSLFNVEKAVAYLSESKLLPTIHHCKAFNHSYTRIDFGSYGSKMFCNLPTIETRQEHSPSHPEAVCMYNQLRDAVLASPCPNYCSIWK